MHIERLKHKNKCLCVCVCTKVPVAQGKVHNEYIQNTYFTLYSVTTHILLKKAWQVTIDSDKWNSNSGNVLKCVRNSVYSIITRNVSLSLFPLSWLTIGRIQYALNA